MRMPPLVPELKVKNFIASVDFYTEVLGFLIEYKRPEEKFAMVSREGSWLMLEETEGVDEVSDIEFVQGRQWRTGKFEYPLGRGINFQICIGDVVATYERILQKGFKVKVPLEERWYRVDQQEVGVKQFLIMDPDGYLLRLQQDIGTRPTALT